MVFAGTFESAMRAIDTNVLVRLITRDDFRRVSAAESFIEKGAWVSVLALAEAAWVLATVYELTSNELIRAIEMLLEHRDLTLQDAETVTVALELFRRETSAGVYRLPDGGVSAESRTSSAGHVRPESCEGCGNSEAITAYLARFRRRGGQPCRDGSRMPENE
jgi:predicted nucleic-acid-binding protein